MPLAGSAWIAIHSPAPTISSSRATSPDGGQTIAKRPPWARTSEAAPSRARRPVESQKSTSVRSTSRRGRRPARVASSRAHSRGAVAMSSSPATWMTLTPDSSCSSTENGSGRGVAHCSTFSGSGRGVNCCFSSSPFRLSFFLGFGFGSTTRNVRAFTPTGPLGPWASIRSR